jgi:Holliday junction DNA helicase RuvB
MIETYEGGPVGIEAIAATMGEERDTLEDVVEPFLLQTKPALVMRTRQGRRASKHAYEHLGLKWKPPKDTNGVGPTFFDSDR